MVGHYILNMGAMEMATRLLIARIYGTDRTAIFNDDLAARIGSLRKSFPRGDRARLSRAIEGERISQSRGGRDLWQRRFWEHLIHDQGDCTRHADYVHWNLVKHGWVRRLADWPHSTFHESRWRRIYPEDCGDENVPSLAAAE